MRWQEEILEVVEALATPDGGMRYRLEPWDARHTIRVVANYDEPGEEARTLEHDERRVSTAKRWLSILFAPALGHLPAHVQARMELEFGAPARLMTMASALPLFVLGLLGTFASQIARMTGDSLFPDWLTGHSFLWIYFAVESLARLFVAFLQEEPMGSLPGVILYEAWRTLTSKRPPAATAAAAATTGKARGWEADDIYKMLEPLLALLPPPEQERLAERFGFDVRRWGRFTAAGLCVVASLNVVIALGQFAQGRGSFWDYFWLPAGLYLVAEQVSRWRRLAGGRPAGSVLGVLIRPMSRKLFVPSSPA